jgi:hypothetical protein
MRSTSHFMPFVMITIFLTMVLVSTMYPPDSRFMPLVAGIPAIGLCILQMLLDRRTRRNEKVLPAEDEHAETNEAAPSEGGVPPHHLPREILIWGYFLGLIAGILLFGFWLTVPVFLGLFLRFEAELKWSRVLILIGIVFAFLHFVIGQGLQTDLHPGFLTERVIGR